MYCLLKQKICLISGFLTGVLSIMLLLSSSLIAQDIIKGVVFHDTNENEYMDAGEGGIENVLVSNGKDIVKTAEDGSYEIPAEDNSIVFVVKPRGWKTAIGEHNIPRFYSIISQNGAEGDNFRGLEPTLPDNLDSVNFPLYSQDESDDFRVLVFGDTQPRNKKEINYSMHDTVQEVIGIDAAFGITLGDLVFDDLNLYDPLNEMIGNIGLPWRHIIGNHDLDYSANNNWDAKGTYFRNYGPSWYAFTWGSAHFVVVDNIRWIVEEDERYYRTGLGETQMEFIANFLNETPDDEQVFFLMHIPMVESTAWENEDERAQFYELLASHSNAVSLAGHTHRHYHRYIGSEDGWPGGSSDFHHSISVGTINGSWWSGALDEYGIPHTLMRDGTPAGYGLLDINGNDWKLTYKASRRPADFQMHILTEDEVSVSEFSETDIYANVFNALPEADVEMKVGKNGEWHSMENVQQRDPAYMAMRERELSIDESTEFRRSGNGNANPRHLWKGKITEELKPGTYTIFVRSVDDWAEYEGRRLIRISE